jgi:hypothetical protein
MKQQLSRIYELLATSEERVESTHKAFNVARTTLTNARTYGTEVHVQAADRALTEAVRIYADALCTRARIIEGYITEKVS